MHGQTDGEDAIIYQLQHREKPTRRPAYATEEEDGARLYKPPESKYHYPDVEYLRQQTTGTHQQAAEDKPQDVSAGVLEEIGEPSSTQSVAYLSADWLEFDLLSR